ncbi:phosphatase PAP2 family protein [Bradyrhizobium jicamae]|uniref:Phosphatase PAP2 family protein n=1 Tax=Bradyrhizobium jicamae TaxID=280332 RepID=A0ABS5FXZ3_9BRAD|nr:phosphatase PAP2 family protein [Bradyrhizobium jicamae]MBR0801121.1 phosphatase PAP2 family protein [Bradyrhizobium jicamae]
MSGDHIRWTFFASIALVDVILSHFVGIRIIIGPWFLTLSICLVIVYAIYRIVRPNVHLAELSSAAMQYLALGWSLTVLSCLVAAFDFPLIDSTLAKVDAALGMSWIGVFDFVRSRQWLNNILGIGYDSILPQTVLLFIWLNAAGRFQRIYEFISLSALTLGISVAVSAVLPAAGAFVTYDVLSLVKADYISLFFGLRDGSITELPLSKVGGIIQFPSFHTALAILLSYAARNVRLLFPIFAVANAVVISATPTMGGHHFADVIAGAIITVATIGAMRAYQRRVSRDSMTSVADAPPLSTSTNAVTSIPPISATRVVQSAGRTRA